MFLTSIVMSSMVFGAWSDQFGTSPHQLPRNSQYVFLLTLMQAMPEIGCSKYELSSCRILSESKATMQHPKELSRAV